MIQQEPIAESGTQNTTINTKIYNISNNMFIQESGLAEQEKKNKIKTPTNVYPIVQQITIIIIIISRISRHNKEPVMSAIKKNIMIIFGFILMWQRNIYKSLFHWEV